MNVPFTAYLHEEYEEIDWRWDNELFKGTELAGLPEDEKERMMEKFGRPFYEVTLKCEFDTETGEVTVLDVKL